MSKGMSQTENGGVGPPNGDIGGIHFGTGDFGRHEPQQVVSIINTQVQKIHDDLENKPELVASRLAIINANLDKYKASVADAANYPANASETIAAHLKEADATADDADMFSRAAARLAMYANKPTIVSDLDGTLTELTDKHHHLLEFIPGSSVAEPLLAKYGRDKFPEVFVKTWQQVLLHAPLLFEAAADGVKLRPGVHEFFQNADSGGMKTVILSANFRPFVEGVIKQIPEAGGAKIWAVEPEDLRATEKSLVLEDIAKTNPESPVIYIGDGLSDVNAINGFVAAYFALENSQFASELKERGVPYFTYRDFTDISSVMSKLHQSQNSGAE